MSLYIENLAVAAESCVPPQPSAITQAAHYEFMPLGTLDAASPCRPHPQRGALHPNDLSLLDLGRYLVPPSPAHAGQAARPSLLDPVAWADEE